MSVQSKRKKSLEKVNTMLGAPMGYEQVSSPNAVEESPLRRPPKLEENNMSILNDIQSQRTGRSSSQTKLKHKKEGSLLQQMQMPQPPIRVSNRDDSDDQRSQKSKKSNKKSSKDNLLFDPSNQLLGFQPGDRRDSSFEKLSERSNSMSEKRKTVKENSLFDGKRNKQTFEELINKQPRRPEISPAPSSLNDYSSYASEVHDDRPQRHKPSQPIKQPQSSQPSQSSTQRHNHLIHVPKEPHEQPMKTPFTQPSMVQRPDINKGSKDLSNGSSFFDLSSQMLQSSNVRSRSRHKLGDLIKEQRLRKSKEVSRVREVDINSLGITKMKGDDDDYQFSDSEKVGRKHHGADDESHLKITQLKYSSTPPKNKDSGEIKRDSVLFNFQHEPVRKSGLKLVTKQLNGSYDSSASRGSSKHKKTKEPKEAVLLPKTDSKYFDLPVKNSPHKPNDSFYDDQPAPLTEPPKIISFDEEDGIPYPVTATQLDRIPSMTSDNFFDRSKYEPSASGSRHPMSRPPRSVSSKQSRHSSKDSSLMDSGMMSSKDSKPKISLNDLVSQNKSKRDTKDKPKDKSKEKFKKESNLMEFYEQSSEDNRSNASRDSRRSSQSRKKESTLIDMNKHGSKNRMGADMRMEDLSSPNVVLRGKNGEKSSNKDNLSSTQPIQQRYVKKNCYFIDSRGKLVKDNYTIQLSGQPKSREKQPTFAETDYGKYYDQQSRSSYSRKSSQRGRDRSRSRSHDKHKANRNHSRDRNSNPVNNHHSSLSEFYRPRQELPQQPLHHQYSSKQSSYTQNEMSYTHEYYGESSEQEVERVSYNQMFSKNQKGSGKKLPRTERSGSKYN